MHKDNIHKADIKRQLIRHMRMLNTKILEYLDTIHN